MGNLISGILQPMPAAQLVTNPHVHHSVKDGDLTNHVAQHVGYLNFPVSNPPISRDGLTLLGA